MFNAAMGTWLVPTVRHLYADGDTVTAFFDTRGIALDGELYSNICSWVLRMENGRIVEARAFFDSIAFDVFWRRETPVTSR